jgi:hypothetical protein
MIERKYINRLISSMPILFDAVEFFALGWDSAFYEGPILNLRPIQFRYYFTYEEMRQNCQRHSAVDPIFWQMSDR